MTGDFASRELALCFEKIERCIGRIVDLMVGSSNSAQSVAAPFPNLQNRARQQAGT